MIRFQAQLLHQGDVKVAKNWGIFGFAVDGNVLAMLKSTSGDESREIAVGMTASISHSSAEQYNGAVEERFAFGVGFGLQVFEKTVEATHVFRFDFDQICNGIGIIAVVRKCVVAGL